MIDEIDKDIYKILYGEEKDQVLEGLIDLKTKSDKRFETYSESTIIEKINLGVSYFELGNDREAAIYFRDKLEYLTENYQQALQKDQIKDQELQDQLYHHLAEKFGTLQAREQVNKCHLTLSRKQAIHTCYLEYLDQLLNEVELEKKLNIKIRINNLLGSNKNNQEMSSELIKIKEEFLANFKSYKIDDRDDLLNYLYFHIYKVLRQQVMKGYYDLYNALSADDKIHLLSYFIKELKTNRLADKDIRYFFNKITCSDSQELKLDIFKEYLRVLPLSKTSKQVSQEAEYNPNDSTLRQSTWASMNESKNNLLLALANIPIELDGSNQTESDNESEKVYYFHPR